MYPEQQPNTDRQAMKELYSLYGYEDEPESQPSFLEMIAKSLKQKQERAVTPMRRSI